jgi:acyl transferase domain-containing protein
MPLSVVTRPVTWRRGTKKRFAGVSAFAFQGSNAHVIVEEAPHPPAATRTTPWRSALLLFSAKSEEALRANARQFAEYLAITNESLVDIAHSAARNRTHFEWRIAVVAADGREARRKIEAHLRGDAAGDLWVGEAKRRAEVQNAETLLSREASSFGDERSWTEALVSLGQAYVLGVNASDALLFKHDGRFVSIPTYPFQRRRYWVGETDGEDVAAARERRWRVLEGLDEGDR